VTARRHKGAAAHINKMAKKYLGEKQFPWGSPGEMRVILVIRPDTIGTLD
jgi:hypothetical protein